MNNYNTQTTAHVGYIIALAVGIAAILYQIKISGFFKNKLLVRMAFYIPLSALFGANVFCLLRISFWAWMSSAVLSVTSDQAVGVTTIYGIQQYLVNIFMNGHGPASLFYSIDQNHFGFSLAFFFGITLLEVLLIDSSIAYREDKILKYYFVGLTLLFTATIVLFVIDPILLNTTITKLFG